MRISQCAFLSRKKSILSFHIFTTTIARRNTLQCNQSASRYSTYGYKEKVALFLEVWLNLRYTEKNWGILRQWKMLIQASKDDVYCLTSVFLWPIFSSPFKAQLWNLEIPLTMRCAFKQCPWNFGRSRILTVKPIVTSFVRLFAPEYTNLLSHRPNFAYSGSATSIALKRSTCSCHW